MSRTSEYVTDIIRLNGNELIGKTRLQKTAYFLEIGGVGYGFDFEYYHYGPYSEDLSIAADDAFALGTLGIHWKNSSNGQPFAVFTVSEHPKESFNEVLEKNRAKILNVLRRYDSISLELAATADFLEKTGYQDPWLETRNRKPTKASDERVSKAQRLLGELRSVSF